MKGVKHIGYNLYLNNDEVEVIDYLVDNNLLPKNMSKAFCVSNMKGMDFDLILFVPEETENKFMHFRFEDFASESETLVYLASMFRNLSLENYNSYKPAQKKVEEVYYMLPTYRALFGYKYNEESEHYQKENLNNF